MTAAPVKNQLRRYKLTKWSNEDGKGGTLPRSNYTSSPRPFICPHDCHLLNYNDVNPRGRKKRKLDLDSVNIIKDSHVLKRGYFATPKALKHHVRKTNHDYDPEKCHYNCSLCHISKPIIFNSQASYVDHLMNHHSDRCNIYQRYLNVYRSQLSPNTTSSPSTQVLTPQLCTNTILSCITTSESPTNTPSPTVKTELNDDIRLEYHIKTKHPKKIRINMGHLLEANEVSTKNKFVKYNVKLLLNYRLRLYFMASNAISRLDLTCSSCFLFW